MYINNRWCKNISIKKKVCTLHIEFLSISLRPFYLPREIPNVFCIIVYIPPSANKEEGVNTLCDHLSDLENNSLDSLKLILGDFNHCTLKDELPHYHQEVNRPNTRANWTKVHFNLKIGSAHSFVI